ncbi:hypothetical protein Aduo_000867 [Ancylostoma duodenale]
MPTRVLIHKRHGEAPTLIFSMSIFMKVAVIAIIVCYCSNANIIRIRQQEKRTDSPSSNETDTPHSMLVNTSTLPATMSGKDQQIGKKEAGNTSEENILSGGRNMQKTSSVGAEPTHRPLRVLQNETDVGVKSGATDEFLLPRRSRSKNRPEQRTLKTRFKSMKYPLYFKKHRGSLLRSAIVDKQPGDTRNGPDLPVPSTSEPGTGDKEGGDVKPPPTTFENSNKTGAVYNVFLTLDLGKDNKKTRKVLRKLLDALGDDDSEKSPAPLPATERPTSKQPLPKLPLLEGSPSDRPSTELPPPEQPPPERTTRKRPRSRRPLSRRPKYPGRKVTRPPPPFPDETYSDYEDTEEPPAAEGTTSLSPLDLLNKGGLAMSQEDILTVTHPCSTDHKRYTRKREEAGCVGAVAFSTIVCREFLDCMLTEDGPAGKCAPKICTQFEAMPKSGKCFRELFACK